MPLAPQNAASRILALDVFRGFTVALMLVVNTPGDWGAIYAPFRHAEWHGCTLADLVFPFFLFIVGVTTVLSLDARRARGASLGQLQNQVLRRGTILIALGLVVAAFPFFPSTRFTEIRIPGVLQRIGICYLIAGTLVLRTRWKTQAAIVAALLIGYWFILTRGPLWPPEATVGAAWDRAILGGHLWVNSKTWDPEGILSTFPAVASVLLGSLAAARLSSSRGSLVDHVRSIAIAGGSLAAAGWAWGRVLPINKALWTSSYVVFTGGLACVTLAGVIWAIDLRGWKKPFHPFVPFGLNPTIAFVGSAMAARLMYSVIRWTEADGSSRSLQAFLYESVFAPWLPARAASLAFALSIALLWYFALKALADKKLILKI